MSRRNIRVFLRLNSSLLVRLYSSEDSELNIRNLLREIICLELMLRFDRRLEMYLKGRVVLDSCLYLREPGLSLLTL